MDRKGDDFEAGTLALIEKFIKDGIIGIRDSVVQIRNKAKYSSSLLNGEIEFDLTVEVFSPDIENHSLLYVIECKGNKEGECLRRIETFHSQLLDLQEKNVKGVFITNLSLPPNAMSLVDHTGMIVIEGESRGNVKVILGEGKRGVNNEIPFVKKCGDDFLLGEGIKSIEKIIDTAILTSSRDELNKLAKKDIEGLAAEILENIDPRFIEKIRGMSIPKMEHFLSRHDIEIDVFEDDILFGYCDIEKRRIGINKVIRGGERALFVYAHELGHFVLHKKMNLGEQVCDYFEDSKSNFQTQETHLSKAKDWIEWEANCFASSFLLHKDVFLKRLMITQIRNKTRHGPIYLNNEKKNVENYFYIVKHLAYIFNVTQASVIHKLKELGMVTSQRNLSLVGKMNSEIDMEYYV